MSACPDPTTSPAYQGTHGDSSYYLFPTQDLPLFDPLRSLGVPEPLIDVVEPFFRVIVELGYDRSIPPWEPTPARLIPPLHPVKGGRRSCQRGRRGHQQRRCPDRLATAVEHSRAGHACGTGHRNRYSRIFHQVTSKDTPTETGQATVDGNGDQTQQVTLDVNGDRNPAGDLDSARRPNPSGDVGFTRRRESSRCRRRQPVLPRRPPRQRLSLRSAPRRPSRRSLPVSRSKTRPVVRDSLRGGPSVLPDRSITVAAGHPRPHRRQPLRRRPAAPFTRRVWRRRPPLFT